MIPQNELRINNLVIIDDNLFGPDKGNRPPHYYTICPNDPGELDSFPDGEENGVSPIPLTPYVLKKVGFHENEGVFSKEYALHGDATIDLTLSMGRYHLTANGLLIGNGMTALHQLQNLWFVLVGEEMNTDLLEEAERQARTPPTPTGKILDIPPPLF